MRPSYADKARVFKAVGYTPNPVQVPAHQSRSRLIAVFGGERAGKSRWMAMEAMGRLPWCKRIAICGQEYANTRAEFLYMAEAAQRIGAVEGRVRMPEQRPWRFETRGGDLRCVVETISLQDGASELTGTGRAFDLVIIAEAGLVRYDCFLAARGRVAETRGTVLLSGTMWDDWGWYADLFRLLENPANILGGERFILPSWQNLAIYPGGQQDAEIVALRGALKEEAARRIDAALVPSPATIYSEFSRLTHSSKPLPLDKGPVTLWVDAGWYPSCYVVLAVQWVKYANGLMVAHVIDEVAEFHQIHHTVVQICKARPWWPQVKRLVGGHEVGQHQAQKSTAEIWQELTGINLESAPAGIQDGIRRVKTFLRDPASGEIRLFVDPRCTRTLEEFSKYHKVTDSKGNVVGEEPADEWNDAMDCIRNGLVQAYGWVDPRPRLAKVQQRDSFAYLK